MKRLLSILFMLGSLLLLIGAGSYITHWALSPYLFTAGAVLVAVAQAFSIPRDASLTLKRLHIQQVFGAVLLVLGGVFMFTTHGNEWIVCMTIAAVLQLYTSFRIPNQEKKEADK